MFRLCFDYGHGGNDPGATYKGRKEKDDNLYIGSRIAKEIRRHGVIVDETRTKDVTMTLRERSNYECKRNYDYFISFHRNAWKPETGSGVETFTYLNTSQKSKNLAKKIQSNLAEIGFINRGVKKANFHVLRETKAPAILMEIGFIDNTEDNKLFDRKKEDIIRGISQAILEQLGVVYNGKINSNT
ncbi:MAG: N-acetylmuramoyl-L-alanine amidase family protein, partial [Senegalia sp. (in: firmicutes)]|uniref:N-acetylmuramoyl-L-alanine amidase family protein n=1 Tax=Senegalia sp. (in: firmicutes) TaxID=1924098 RepID=UPI003F944EB0